MKIITYTTTDPDAPEAMRAAAAMVSDGRPGTHWLATGPTEEAAREKLTALWDDAADVAVSRQRAKAKAKTPTEAAAPAPQAAPVEVGDVI